MKNVRPEKNHAPTQKDIADALGLAQSTVATALNPRSEHRVQTTTAERIKAYATKIGYRPQRFAQIMRGDRTRVIGVLVRLGSYSANHELVRQLANELNRSSYRIVMVDPEWFDGSPEAVRDYLLDQAVEGVIFCNVTPQNVFQEFQEILPPNLPVVAVNSSAERVTSVQADTETAFQFLTSYHLALGSRRLAFLAMFRDSGMLAYPDGTVQRINGFVRAIKEAGGTIVADESAQELLELRGCRTHLPTGFAGISGEIIYPFRSVDVANAYENGFRETIRRIEDVSSLDSMICTNDDTALGALAAFSDRGVRVPDDIRVSGYDGTLAGQFASTPLTTVRKPLTAIVRRAVEAMMTRIQNPGDEAVTTRDLIPAEIVVRRSTGSPEENRRLTATGFFQASAAAVRFQFPPARDLGRRPERDQPEIPAA